MTLQDFKAAYNDRFKQTVTYRNKEGETLKGLLITFVWLNVSGEPFICVNNDVTSIPVKDVIALKTTDTPWY